MTLRGYLPAAEAAALLDGADILISTSHDEGLGLPLIEAQYAGLAVAAPDKPVFREVLGASGLLLNVENERDAASRIAAMAGVPGWRLRAADAGAANITRWNALAEADRANVIALIETLSRRS